LDPKKTLRARDHNEQKNETNARIVLMSIANIY